MSKVTRIVYSKNLNQGKYDHLAELAERLGQLRMEVWQRFGSLGGIGLTHRQIRDQWLAAGREFDVPARLWKETLRDAFSDIVTYREAAKVAVRKGIRRRFPDKKDKGQEAERKRLYTTLKHDGWLSDPYLRRMMRKHFKHGQTQVADQIILDTGCYTAFARNGQAWLKVMSLTAGQRIVIPLNTSHLPGGTLRLILRDDRVEVHYAVDEQIASSTKPCGKATVGIDKGYSEVFTDSEGETHGDGLGEILSQESDYLKKKYERRNRLRAIAKKKPHKAAKIKAHNLGRQKLNKRKAKHTKRVKDIVYQATHRVVDKAETIAAEDLTAPIKSKSYGKNQNRRLAGWIKGTMAEALESITRRRGSTLCLVNCAYTSQMDSRYGILLGERNGDAFYCFDGVVLPTDWNAAGNILARMDDQDISLYTPFNEVKKILEARTKKWLGLLNQDSSCSGSPVSGGDNPIVVPLSTESESPF